MVQINYYINNEVTTVYTNQENQLWYTTIV